jgi:two-component system sensor histidine kinase KdpD
MFPPSLKLLTRLERPGRIARVLRYGWSLLIVVVATGLSALVTPEFSPTNLIMIYLLAVVVAAFYLGRGPAILASCLGVLAFDYLFIPPRYTLTVADTEYLLSLAGLLVVGVVISYLTARAREQAEAARRREAETSALYALSRDLAAADTLEAILKAITTHVGQAFGWNVVVLLPEGKRLQSYPRTSEQPAPEDTRAAEWTFQHGEPAGRGTGHFSTAWARYMPMKSSLVTLGVMGVRPTDPKRSFVHQELHLLEAFTSQAALAVERARLAEQARQAELLKITDKLQTALLNSISHDLRTPLVSITGALSSLADDELALDDAARRSLIETAGEEADRLNRLVGNLLDMTRLEAGAMRINREACDIQDVIGSALEELGSRLENRTVSVEVPDELPLVEMDFVLVERVLVNVIDNALKYSPADTAIEIRAHAAGAFIEVDVADRGLGIPPEDLKRIFDKFYRVQRPDNVSGTGLGLSICKGIVQAHGGFIAAENRPEGGTIVTISLPLR